MKAFTVSLVANHFSSRVASALLGKAAGWKGEAADELAAVSAFAAQLVAALPGVYGSVRGMEQTARDADGRLPFVCEVRTAPEGKSPRLFAGLARPADGFRVGPFWGVHTYPVLMPGWASDYHGVDGLLAQLGIYGSDNAALSAAGLFIDRGRIRKGQTVTHEGRHYYATTREATEAGKFIRGEHVMRSGWAVEVKAAEAARQARAAEWAATV